MRRGVAKADIARWQRKLAALREKLDMEITGNVLATGRQDLLDRLRGEFAKLEALERTVDEHASALVEGGR